MGAYAHYDSVHTISHSVQNASYTLLGENKERNITFAYYEQHDTKRCYASIFDHMQYHPCDGNSRAMMYLVMSSTLKPARAKRPRKEGTACFSGRPVSIHLRPEIAIEYGDPKFIANVRVSQLVFIQYCGAQLPRT